MINIYLLLYLGNSTPEKLLKGRLCHFQAIQAQFEQTVVCPKGVYITRRYTYLYTERETENYFRIYRTEEINVMIFTLGIIKFASVKGLSRI